MSTLQVLQIPQVKDNTLANEYARRYQSIRLEALKLEPQAFSSKYETESGWPLHRFADRLKNPSSRTFIGIQSMNESKTVKSQQLLLQNHWQGTLTLLGPKFRGLEAIAATKPPWDLFEQPEGSEEPETQDPVQQVVYLIVGVYVTAPARSKGAGRKLVQASLSAIKAEALALRASSALCIVMAGNENESGKTFWLRNGFKLVGEDYFDPGSSHLGARLQQDVLHKGLSPDA